MMSLYKMSRFSQLFKLLLVTLCSAFAGNAPALAHEDSHQQHSATSAPHADNHADNSVAQPFGVAGQAAAVQRTITLRMSDDMRFTPDHITVKQGETLRLRVENHGQTLHELVLGTPASLAAHQAMMQRNPNMVHNAPYMAHVAASQAGELIWQFNHVGEFAFACLLPGHYEAGMHGSISVQP